MEPMTTKRTSRGISQTNDPNQAADLESVVGNEPLQTRKGPTFNSQVDLFITHYRVRLADPDGISAKAAIDGLVLCGILKDDSAKEVREVRHRQVKVKNASDEATEIEIKAVTQ
jgi:hypothetical protein